MINGENGVGERTVVTTITTNDRWYGVRGFFRWAESKTYKMHMRVLLSRYRAYTTCPSCNGGRFQPEALNYQIVVARRRTKSTQPEPRCVNPSRLCCAFDCRCARCFSRDRHPTERFDRQMLRDEICARLNYLVRSRPRLSDARSLHAHAQRRRSPAGEPDDLSRRVAGEHTFRYGRAEHRPASARCRPARSRHA